MEGNDEKLSNALAQHNVDVNYVDKAGYSSLHWASYRGHPEIVSLLINSGANINAANEVYFVSLTWWCTEGNNIFLFLQKQKCWTPLHLAAKYGHVECVRRLVMAGGNAVVFDSV